MEDSTKQEGGAGIGAFTDNIKKMVLLQDQIKALGETARDARKPLKESLDSTQAEIIEFMRAENIEVCNYHDDKIELSTVTRPGSLTRKTLKASLDDYHFGRNGVPANADDCFAHVLRELGEREVTVLRRIRKRKSKPRKAANRRGGRQGAAAAAAAAMADEAGGANGGEDRAPALGPNSDDDLSSDGGDSDNL